MCWAAGCYLFAPLCSLLLLQLLLFFHTLTFSPGSILFWSLLNCCACAAWWGCVQLLEHSFTRRAGQSESLDRPQRWQRAGLGFSRIVPRCTWLPLNCRGTHTPCPFPRPRPRAPRPSPLRRALTGETGIILTTMGYIPAVVRIHTKPKVTVVRVRAISGPVRASDLSARRVVLRRLPGGLFGGGALATTRSCAEGERRIRVTPG